LKFLLIGPIQNDFIELRTIASFPSVELFKPRTNKNSRIRIPVNSPQSSIYTSRPFSLVTLVYSVYNDRFLPVKFEIFFNFFPRKSQLWTFCSEINEQDNVQIWTQIESNSMTFARQVLLDIEHKVVSSTPRLIRWTQIQSYVERWTASRFLSHDQRASRLGFFNHYSLF
jgi:hypothetical protein